MCLSLTTGLTTFLSSYMPFYIQACDFNKYNNIYLLSVCLLSRLTLYLFNGVTHFTIMKRNKPSYSLLLLKSTYGNNVFIT